MTAAVQAVTPHLVIRGAAEAVEFYKKALGATETMRVPAEDGKRLMHVELSILGMRIFVVDDFSDLPNCPGGDKIVSPAKLNGTSVVIHLEVANCDEAVKRAADAGGTVLTAPFDAFWGARYGQVVDPFGHAWSFAHMLPALPH
ncbi:VOC family protein [Bradyrhizobium sp. U87765 SZCCT0131]|uniref:VOC family protein n=1 Tax=unclassified Bradyrhizobium TaxID=2631580 RepID=UPI001BAD7FF6|nr:MULTISPECIES: VOC family protein [unclassified Bradyrhizobium]MBR1218075.1 VOC family protein [Bradyrhizobium sp. U87765 SZCCT0131]MBR1260979.1 VOC family protein [Bradyrhizobium sp. U87765 SZCCT0134]MBR1303573.1 VOC family protein [Bradyrhizobium sp. U87765 SZCCT0110]MBR1319179.1 VOC family protein [Bradyrhizobium sp. U87765 SZCCT0109]MBR1347504.1 VOC family protein [Bradyrhizobium sp. U87765 SZCCT0048]